MKIFGKTFEINRKSLRFRLWAYILLFTLLVLGAIWVLQVYFLNNYYEDMKITETKETVRQIVSHYKDEDIIEKIKDIYIKNDMYIQIETADGVILFSPSMEKSWQPSFVYFSEIQAVRDELYRRGGSSVSVIIEDPYTNSNTLAYAGFLENASGGEDLLYIFSPLYPISSTIDIIRKQLLYITVIAVLLACAVGIIISGRIVKPLNRMNKSAKELAKGQYGIVFEGGGYTELNQLADTLTYTSLELEKSTNLQKDLMANVSHDLRTPLTMVRSYAEMIRDISGDNAEKRNEHLRVIIDEADRLNNLVSDMLSISRMQSGVLVLDKKSFDFSDAIETVIHSYDVLNEREGYNIRLVCPPNLLLTADEAKIKQVLSNLITNAVKYCGDDKRVDVVVSADGKGVHTGIIRCEVRDYGAGIAADELDKIWDRYYKSSNHHVRSVSGTGLGLAIVKEILLLHNARFGVSSALGSGSTFWFEIQ